MGQPHHRTVAGTKRARQGMAQTNRTGMATPEPSAEVKAWNERVEAEKAAKRGKVRG